MWKTTRTPDSLFFSRNDPADPRMGDAVLRAADDYKRAKVVLIGCPQDEGVRRNGGRVGAAQAPAEIWRFFYRLVAVPKHFDVREQQTPFGP